MLDYLDNLTETTRQHKNVHAFRNDHDYISFARVGFWREMEIIHDEEAAVECVNDILNESDDGE